MAHRLVEVGLAIFEVFLVKGLVYFLMTL